MQYPRTEIRKVENGYIVQQGRCEYVFDNFIETMETLARQYDETFVSEHIIQYCKEHAGEKMEEPIIDQYGIVIPTDNLNSV